VLVEKYTGEKMKTSINKTKLTASIAIVLLIASAFIVMINAPVQAQVSVSPAVALLYPEQIQDSGGIPLPSGVTPDLTVDTIAHMSFRPNPTGVNQPFLVNLWTQPALYASRYFKDYTVTITKPDGTQEVIKMDSYYADTTAWFEYIANQVGTWTLEFNFLGAFYPAGIYCRPGSEAPPGITGVGAGQTVDRYWNFTESAYYKPSSDGPYELEVQEDMVLSWPPSPLPTDYWTRPASPENREWWSILGNYPWHGPGGGPDWPADTNIYWSDRYGFTPWVQAPNSAHIVWKRQDDIGGLIGGQLGQTTMSLGSRGYGTATNIPSIIYAGRCYQSITKTGTGTSAPLYWQCYDLRTGEVYWEYPATITGYGFFGPTTATPTVIEYYSGAGEVPGGGAGAMGMEMSLVYIGGGRLIKYSPWTGAISLNVSISPVSSGTYYRNGYALSVQNLGGGQYRLINWTTLGPTANFAERVVSNTTWPWSSTGQFDLNVGIAATTQSITPPATGVATDVRISAANLKTGAELWDITSDVGFGLFSGSTAVADHGKFAVRFNDGKWRCWDLYSGNKLWESEVSSWPWGTFGCYGVQSYGGMILSYQYDGVVAYSWINGEQVWFYQSKTPYPYETVYQDNYPFFPGINQIADGKLYTYNVEHTPSQPYTRGWRLHCINITTGEGIWNITGLMTPGPVADGYLTAGSMYDGYMYVFGKGQSTTTVSAPDVAVPKGTAITIKGSVLDQSPAQPGAACVSKESMTTYMEYLHMQKPIPDGYTVTGVPVMLLAFDSDGGVIDIGTTSTDMSGKFAYAWTPPDEGLYKITATFLGDDSYGSSWDETAVTVGPAPEEVDLSPLEGSVSNARTQIEDSIGSQTTYIIAILVLVIIALVIALYFGLKPRK